MEHIFSIEDDELIRALLEHCFKQANPYGYYAGSAEDRWRPGSCEKPILAIINLHFQEEHRFSFTEQLRTTPQLGKLLTLCLINSCSDYDLRFLTQA